MRKGWTRFGTSKGTVRRQGSTPVLVWYSFEYVDVTFELFQGLRCANRLVAVDGQDLGAGLANRRGAKLQGVRRLA